MKFGPVPRDEALGAILAHSVPLGRERLRKGVILSQADLARLAKAGIDRVVVARLEPDDVGEDAAAGRLAHAMVPDPAGRGLRMGTAATGRVNIYALGAGIVEIDAAAIHAINAVHPMITVATLPPFQRVTARSMVATVKIIAYGVPEAALAAAEAVAAGAIRLREPVLDRVDLIQTRVGAEDGAKGQRAIKARLDRLGVALGPRCVIEHDEPALADALRASEADMLCILTGSATSDVMDTAPQALRLAGGEVAHFGMPVDPGNLLFFGTLRGKPVVGLPGCARSPAINGADWVLERLICGVEVSPGDIARMGVGGLLKEIPSRPRPREG